MGNSKLFFGYVYRLVHEGGKGDSCMKCSNCDNQIERFISMIVFLQWSSFYSTFVLVTSIDSYIISFYHSEHDTQLAPMNVEWGTTISTTCSLK